MKQVPNQFPTRDPGVRRIALIGEAPGADEVALGMPFVGQSGRVLDQLLAHNGVFRSGVFVGNVSQHRPSESSNDFNLLDWNSHEVQSGIAQLEDDLIAFMPNIVVAMGNAAFHLFRNGNQAPPKSQRGFFQWPQAIGTWRGSLSLVPNEFEPLGRNTTYGGWKLLPTYHPAATFRKPALAYPLGCDITRAVEESASLDLHLPPRNFMVAETAGDVIAYCDALRRNPVPVGFDIEGGLGGLQCCSFAPTPNDAFVIDLLAPDALVNRAIIGVLEDPAVIKVCWNTMYERAILKAVWNCELRGYEDGMLAWWERFSELPKGLDFVASILTRQPYWAEGIGWDSKTGRPKVVGEPFWRYNAIDSMVTIEIWKHPIIQEIVRRREPVPFESVRGMVAAAHTCAAA